MVILACHSPLPRSTNLNISNIISYLIFSYELTYAMCSLESKITYVKYTTFYLTLKTMLLNSLHQQQVAEEVLPSDVSCSLMTDNSLAESGIIEDPTIQYNKNLIHSKVIENSS